MNQSQLNEFMCGQFNRKDVFVLICVLHILPGP